MILGIGLLPLITFKIKGAKNGSNLELKTSRILYVKDLKIAMVFNVNKGIAISSGVETSKISYF